MSLHIYTYGRLVMKLNDEAKFWLDPVQLAANYGFNTSEINEVERW